MKDLEDYRRQIRNLANAKDWNDSQLWLERSIFVEVGELVKAVEEKKSQDEVAEEFADVMHYLIQYVNKFASFSNLDKALQDKIDSNWKNKKKTWDDSKETIVKK